MNRIDVPVLFNPTPPSVSVIGNMETRVTACGPLMNIKKTSVHGTHIGIFTNTAVDLGEDYELVPVVNNQNEQVYYTEKQFSDGVTRLFGSQAIITTALPNVSAASSFSFGFAGNNGGGNGGAGASSAMTRIVTKITVAACELRAYRSEKVQKTVGGLTREDLIAALAEAQLRAKVSVKIPERTWHTCPKQGCKAPKHGYYSYGDREADAEAEVKMKEKKN
jgi:hypothetical protein